MGLKISKQELTELLARGATLGPSVQLPRIEDVVQPETILLGRGERQPGEMNKLESEYAAYLDTRKIAGEILQWHYEGVKFRLAKKTFYTPDFMVLLANCVIEIHEVKGHWEDDARVKIKVAAAMYPFRFVAITKGKQGWIFEDFA